MIRAALLLVGLVAFLVFAAGISAGDLILAAVAVAAGLGGAHLLDILE